MSRAIIENTNEDRKNASHPSSSRRLEIINIIPIIVVFYSFLLLSPEVNLQIFSINFPSYRIALIIMSIPSLWMAMNSKLFKINLIDFSVFFISFLIILSSSVNYGVPSGLIRGSGIFIDTFFSYFIARTCIRSIDSIRYFLLLILPGLAFAGSVMVVESISGELILRPGFASVFGGVTDYVAGEPVGVLSLRPEYRLGGLLRAYGPFPHPILAGVVLIGFLPLYYFSGLRSWPYALGIAASLTGFFGLSSAGLFALILASSAIALYHIKPHIPKMTWWKICGMVMLLAWSANMATQNGIIWVISRLTLTPDTAYYRILIWEYGSKSVAKNPWFGIGYQQWERPDWMIGQSVDAHFLALAIRDGVIVPLALLGAIVFGAIRLGLIVPRLRPVDRPLAIGLNISAILYLIVGQTVTFFGSANLVFMAIIGILSSVYSSENLKLRNKKFANHKKVNRLPIK